MQINQLEDVKPKMMGRKLRSGVIGKGRCSKNAEERMTTKVEHIAIECNTKGQDRYFI
jgi:hypothetical protein